MSDIPIVVLEAPFDSDLFELGCQLRREVFMQEQGVSYAEEMDGKDLDALHWVALVDGNVVGVLRVLQLAEHVKIGRFAVRKAYRGRGVGQQLFRFVLSEIQNLGHSKMFLEAQIDRVGFYEQFGFFPFGDTYLDAGIIHRAMKNY